MLGETSMHLARYCSTLSCGMLSASWRSLSSHAEISVAARSPRSYRSRPRSSMWLMRTRRSYHAL
jgi:hypothetical protein